MSTIAQTVIEEKDSSEDYLAKKRLKWDMVEELVNEQLTDQVSQQTKSQVFEPKLSTFVLERSYRVMAQLATGKVEPISKNDIGSAMLMNLILDKYIIPNANAQFDFLTKLRLIDFYSNIYGSSYALIDWDVRKNGYIGPDMWLLNIRDVFPQEGAISLNDSDQVIIRTWRSKSFFEGLKDKKGYRNIRQINEKLEDLANKEKDSKSESNRERTEYPTRAGMKAKGFYEVLTRFERDRWVDVCVDASLEFRDQANPHDDEDLPVKAKYSIPLLDDFMGMGDFERGASMQKVLNSNWNLYLDGVAMTVKPPMLINKDNIANMSSLKLMPATKWFVRNNINNAAQPLQVNPQGINTFNNVYQVANAALMNLFGTTETNVSSQVDPGFGKTPQAISKQSQRENTRDNADRFYMERFVTDVYNKFVNLTSKKQSKAITIRMFDAELQNLRRSYPEIDEMYNDKTGKLTITKKQTGSILYDYQIVSGSTFASDKQEQQQNLAMILSLYQAANTPQGNLLVAQLKQEGYDFKFGELFKRIISGGGIQDWDKILVEMTDQEQADNTLNQHASEFNQAIGAAMPGAQPQPGQGLPEQMPMDQGQPQMQPNQMMPGQIG